MKINIVTIERAKDNLNLQIVGLNYNKLTFNLKVKHCFSPQ